MRGEGARRKSEGGGIGRRWGGVWMSGGGLQVGRSHAEGTGEMSWGRTRTRGRWGVRGRVGRGIGGSREDGEAGRREGGWGTRRTVKGGGRFAFGSKKGGVGRGGGRRSRPQWQGEEGTGSMQRFGRRARGEYDDRQTREKCMGRRRRVCSSGGEGGGGMRETEVSGGRRRRGGVPLRQGTDGGGERAEEERAGVRA